ncbi:hypothetical protein [Helicobacter sp. 12S02232-10]|uniref:hypothetical protein n=1 Tax=Helicobacter sp. 12S02232-10 TaxID=1476197 RepID=UPI0015DDC065|nr:hypothetical protein [Helicobacter sp. 12S02232-10]
MTLLCFHSGTGRERNDEVHYITGRLQALNQLLDYNQYLFGENGKESFLKYKDYIK